MSPKAPGRINIFIHVGRGRKWVAEIGQQCCRAKRAFTSPLVFIILRTASPNLSDVLGDIFLEHLNTDRNAGYASCCFRCKLLLITHDMTFRS
ncbi:hypothetical protein ALC56_00540 [Trachymyrmex septentrionalis]|uniref:Uncharacterized protein n=1 Tax=Trachymyrmex septentrionalis TaxID=34720 RepID=A0A195FXB4_9HYME|nr:hypothetical protein ALC56_00540 [Trachymyrmex septentrionalis]